MRTGRDLIDQPEHSVGESERIESGAGHRQQFLQEERTLPVDQSVRARGVRLSGSENAQQDDAQDSADAVNAPDVEGIVPAQLVLQATAK